MSERFWLAVSWIFCVIVGVLARFIISAAIGIWSNEGTLAVPSWLFVMVDGVPTVVAGVMFVYMFCCPDDHVIRLRKVK